MSTLLATTEINTSRSTTSLATLAAMDPRSYGALSTNGSYTLTVFVQSVNANYSITNMGASWTGTNTTTLIASPASRFAWTQVTPPLASQPVTPQMFGATAYSGSWTGYPYENSTTNQPINPGSGTFSLAAQFIAPDMTVLSSQGIFKLHPATGGNRNLEIYLYRGGGQTYISTLLRSTTGGSSTSGGQPGAGLALYAVSLTTGTSYSMVFTRSGTNRVVYLNGSVQTAASDTNPTAWTDAIGYGSAVDLQLGLTSSAQIFTRPITDSRYWTSVLSAGQAAVPFSTAGYAASLASSIQTDMVDSTTAIQAAVDYVSSKGGGEVFFPPGTYLSGTIQGKYGVTFNGGSGVPAYGSGISGSGSSIVSIAGTTNNLIEINGKLSGTTPTLINSSYNDGSSYTNWYMAAGVKNLTLNTYASPGGAPVYVAYANAVDLSDLTLDSTGPMAYTVFSNFGKFHRLKSHYAKYGIVANGQSDSQITECDYGGTPLNLFWYGNGGLIQNNFIYNTSATNAAITGTVVAATDLFTIANHGLYNLQPVWAFTGSGTLPAPLVKDTLYYVIWVSADTFKLGTRMDQTSGNSPGAMQGTGVDITTTGSPGWYLAPGHSESVNIWNGQLNLVSGNRFDQNYNSSIWLMSDASYPNSGRYNSVVGNTLIDNGWSGQTTAPTVYLQNSSSNLITGNSITAGHSTAVGAVGIQAVASTGLQLYPNQFGSIITTPVTIDGSSSLETTLGGNLSLSGTLGVAGVSTLAGVTNTTTGISSTLYVGGTATLAGAATVGTTLGVTGALTAATVNGNTITTGTGTLTIAAGKTFTASKTLSLTGTDSTTMTFPTTSATIARTDAAQTFTGTQAFAGITSTSETVTAATNVTAITANASGTGYPLILNGTTTSFAQLNQSYSDTSGNSAGILFQRTRGSSGAQTAVQTGDKIFLLTGAGYNSSAGYNYNSGFIQLTAREGFTSSAGGADMTISVTPIGAVSAATQMVLNGSKIITSVPTDTYGVIDGSAAAASYVGRVVSSAIASASAVTLTNATATAVTSISLPAGDWDVEGNVNLNLTAATQTACVAGLSTSVATPTDGSEVYSGLQTTALTAVNSITLPRKIFNSSGTQTIYLVVKPTFTGTGETGFGSITARRVR